MSVGSSVTSSSSSQAHLTASAPFRAGPSRSVSGRLSGTAGGGASLRCSGFPLPFGHRHSLLDHPIPAEGLGLPHGRLTGRQRRPDLDRVTTFRTHELRPGWVPPLPQGRRCSPGRPTVTNRRLPLLGGQSLRPDTTSHRRGSVLMRHQRGFTRFTRPVFPSPVVPGWNGHPRALP